MLDVFDDDDGVVDDETDGENHREERQCVDAEVKRDERDERADQGYGHSQERYERRAPALQKDEDDEHDEEKRLDEGVHDLRDGFTDIVRAVHDRIAAHLRRKVRPCLVNDLFDSGDRLHGIGITRELNAHGKRRMSIRLRDDVVRLRARLHARDILEAHEAAVARSAHDDITKLLGRHETAVDLARRLLFLHLGHGHRADCTRRRLYILLLDRSCNVGDRQAEFCELVGIEPDAHRIVRAEDLDVADAMHTLDLIEEIDRRVILEERTVVEVAIRIHGDHHRHVVRGLLRRDANRLDVVGQARRRHGNIVLHLDRIHVAVRSGLERDRKTIAPRVVRVGAHVVHALRAVDLILNDLRDRLIDDARARARIHRADGDRRRRDLRVLRDRQLKPRDNAADNDQKRDDDGKNRPMDKKLCQAYALLCLFAQRAHTGIKCLHIVFE